MLEGRGNNGGWLLVAGAVVALIAFTGLLYVRGSNAPRLNLGGSAPTAQPSVRPTASPSAAATAVAGLSSARPSAKPSATGAVAAATGTLSDQPSTTPTVKPAGAPTKTPRAAATPKPTATPAGYRLPQSPQPATVALENGQGDCPNYPTGGVVVESTFTLSNGRLTAISPSTQKLTGKVQANGSFSLSGSNPTERWVGTLTETGGTGSYFVVSNGCTEGYDTTIAFHT